MGLYRFEVSGSNRTTLMGRFHSGCFRLMYIIAEMDRAMNVVSINDIKDMSVNTSPENSTAIVMNI